ncbi:putative Myb/SANT-like domain-containing protein [Arabidopsis thaliana]
MGNSQQKKRKKGDYNPWSPEETKLLVQLLVEGINNNWRDSNGTISKLTVETKFMPEINKEFCRSKNYNHYLSRMKYLKIQYQSCLDLQRFSSGFGWDPLTKRFTASDEVWSDYLKAHPNNKQLRYDTFEFFYELQIIFGEGVATGKNAIGLCDSTDALTYKAGENPRKEYVDDFDNVYEYDTTTHHESSEHYTPFMSHGTSESPTEKLPPRKRTRSERSTSQKEESPMMVVSSKILDIIQQREERQQKKWHRKRITFGML